MFIRGYQVPLKTVYEVCGKATPGNDLAQFIIGQDVSSDAIFDPTMTRRQSAETFGLYVGGYLIVAKDRDTLIRGLAGHDGKIDSTSSFSLIWGGYGGTGLQRWQAARRSVAAARQEARQNHTILIRRTAELRARAYWILLLSREPAIFQGAKYPGYTGDANISFINAAGGIPFKTLAYLMNNNKEVNFKLKWKKDKFEGTEEWENRGGTPW